MSPATKCQICGANTTKPQALMVDNHEHSLVFSIDFCEKCKQKVIKFVNELIKTEGK